MKRRGFTAESFYQTYRDMCSQPMRFLGSIESGDVWFSRHFDPILACISPTTLLVMYYPGFWSRDKTVAYLNEAFHWLEGRRSNFPYPNGGIKFAARKNEDGIIPFTNTYLGIGLGMLITCLWQRALGGDHEPTNQPESRTRFFTNGLNT